MQIRGKNGVVFRFNRPQIDANPGHAAATICEQSDRCLCTRISRTQRQQKLWSERGPVAQKNNFTLELGGRRIEPFDTEDCLTFAATAERINRSKTRYVLAADVNRFRMLNRFLETELRAERSLVLYQ